MALSCIISLSLSFGTILITVIIYRKFFGSYEDYMPDLYFKESAFSQHLLQKCERLTRPFRPTFWASNAHIQTLFSVLLYQPAVLFKRKYLEMRDKGMVALDWMTSEDANSETTTPIVIVLPGLTGTATSVADICYQASRHGYRVVVFNKRGHGGSILTTPHLQSFGDPSDFRQVIEHIHKTYPCCELMAIGVSAGSGLLASYLGEYGSSAILTAGVCISPGYDALRLFSDCIPKLYQIILLRGLKQIISQHSEVLSPCVDLNSALNAYSLMDFDMSVYCRLYHFNTIEQYWLKNNPMRNIQNIQVPVMCINSKDDPICVKKNVPVEKFKHSDNLMLAFTSHGGHCGFLEGFKPQNWAHKLSVDYLDAVREFSDGKIHSG